MIVRLKGIPARNSIIVAATFQFYDSPIKRPVTTDNTKIAITNFNSMIVRLKAVRNDKKHY